MNNGSEIDWEKQAKFWQMKYFELLGHSSQVIGALARPSIVAQVAQHSGSGLLVPNEPAASAAAG